ncbi:MAG: beta-lactamase family protein, partial [Bacteroidales bacterium]|jgi:CubicO group peptidase (beta-lactamase class C family)|nr:beta-lactamase family protein [Bacteroidales bacterium]
MIKMIFGQYIKLFTAVCIMKLVEEGRLNLDQPVFGSGGVLDAEFPGVTGSKATVTPRHFLQHNSGWISNPDPMFTTPYMNQTLDQLITYMLGLSQTYTPGATFSYYNMGFGVLGKIIEKTTGKTYEQYLKEEILQPAGISDIHVGAGSRSQKRGNECVYYPQGGYSAYDNNMPLIAAAGGLIASTSQMMRFLASFDGLTNIPDILNATSRAEMFTAWQPYNMYALGWRVNHSRLYPGGYYHDGNLAGTATMWCGGVNGGYSAAVLCNSRSYISGFDTALYVLLSDILHVYGVPN